MLTHESRQPPSWLIFDVGQISAVFEIRYIDRRAKLARIRLGGFQDNFRVNSSSDTHAVERDWRRSLKELVGRKRKIALPIWRKGRTIARAWILYRVGESVFVREQIFLRGLDSKSGTIPTRSSKTGPDGEISEFLVEVSAIRNFLTAKV